MFKKKEVVVIQQNEYKGKLKEIFLVIHEDKDGNQGVFAEACISNRIGVKVAPELTPYAKEVPLLKKYMKKLNEDIGKELGQTLKIKRFVAIEE